MNGAGRVAPTAVCAVDSEPLVLTFEFRGYEFYCVVCGRKYTYFGPASAPSTPELDARLAELKTRYSTERAERREQAS